MNILNTIIKQFAAGQILLPQDPAFSDYLRDQTWLQGSAELVLFAGSHEDVEKIVSLVHKAKQAGEVPDKFGITVRGGGSGLSGAAVPNGGIVLSLEKMNQISPIPVGSRFVHAMAGAIIAEIEKAAEMVDLYYPAAPSSKELATIGGAVSTNAAGAHSYLYGPTRRYVKKLRVVWADGSSDILGSMAKKSSTGFPLKDLLIGAQGQLGIITEVWLDLIAPPAGRVSLFAALGSAVEAMEKMDLLRNSSIPFSALEFIDQKSMAGAQWPAEVRGAEFAILADIDTAPENQEEYFEAAAEILGESVFVAADENSRRKIWKARENVSLTLASLYRYKVGEDVSVPTENMWPLMEWAYQSGEREGFDVAIWGHAGDGNLHVNFLFNEEERLLSLQQLILELSRRAVELNGSASGEHGLGRLKAAALRFEYSPKVLSLAESLRRSFDPLNTLNPALRL